MPVACHCGSRVLSSSADERSCIKCGTACCSACAYSLESATYVRACAQSILDGEGVPLTLSHAEPEPGHRPPRARGSARRPSSGQRLRPVAHPRRQGPARSLRSPRARVLARRQGPDPAGPPQGLLPQPAGHGGAPAHPRRRGHPPPRQGAGGRDCCRRRPGRARPRAATATRASGRRAPVRIGTYYACAVAVSRRERGGARAPPARRRSTPAARARCRRRSGRCPPRGGRCPC